MRRVHREFFAGFPPAPGWPLIGSTLIGWLACVACVFPTDRAGAVRAEFTVDRAVVTVGDTVRVVADAISGSASLAGADIFYESLDQEIAVVSDQGLVLGVGEGETQVIAVPSAFEGSTADSVIIFVTRGILIQEIVGEVSAPGRVRFGETIELRGLRLTPDSLNVVTIGSVPVPIVGYVARDTNDEASFERLRLRVPVVPINSSLLLVHRGGGTASRPLVVVQEDVFDAVDSIRTVDLALGDYSNDALVATATDPDLLRIVMPAGDYTLTATVLDGQVLLEGEPELRFLAPQPPEYAAQFDTRYISSDVPDVWQWSVEHRGISCDLRSIVYYPTGFFNRIRGRGDRVTLAAKSAVPDTVDFMAATLGERVRYRLEVRSGYHADLPPDVLEENDACVDATPVVLAGATVDLNFDNLTDFDWFDITAGAGMPTPTFDVTPRSEQESNDTFATAESVAFGTRIVGLRDDSTDVDVYAIDAVAGTLVDIDVQAYFATDRYRVFDCPERCGSGVPPYAPPGSGLITDLRVDLWLHDSAGTVVARDPFHPFDSFTRIDGRIRYLVPTTGRYFVRVVGVAGAQGNPVGLEQYYAVDFFAHDALVDLRIDVEGGAAQVDPKVVVVERRGDGNVLLDVLDSSGSVETYARPVHAGSYYVVVLESSGQVGPYRLRVEELPVGPPALGRAP